MSTSVPSVYIHPNSRRVEGGTTAAPKKLTFRPVIDYASLKTKEQLYEEYRIKNIGKADNSWEDDDAH